MLILQEEKNKEIVIPLFSKPIGLKKGEMTFMILISTIRALKLFCLKCNPYQLRHCFESSFPYTIVLTLSLTHITKLLEPKSAETWLELIIIIASRKLLFGPQAVLRLLCYDAFVETVVLFYFYHHCMLCK